MHTLSRVTIPSATRRISGTSKICFILVGPCGGVQQCCDNVPMIHLFQAAELEQAGRQGVRTSISAQMTGVAWCRMCLLCFVNDVSLRYVICISNVTYYQCMLYTLQCILYIHYIDMTQNQGTSFENNLVTFWSSKPQMFWASPRDRHNLY